MQTHVYVGKHVQVEADTVSLISLHLIYGGRTSQLSSKLADKAGLVSQLALGSPSLPFWDYILVGWFIYSVHFSPYV